MKKISAIFIILCFFGCTASSRESGKKEKSRIKRSLPFKVHNAKTTGGSRISVGKMIHQKCIICHNNSTKGTLHPFINTKSDRVNPHTQKPFTRMEAICTSCHDFFHYIHPDRISVRPDKVSFPKDIRLEEGRITCLSCHNLHQQEPSYKKLKWPVKGEEHIKDFCLNCHVRADQIKEDVHYMLLELRNLVKDDDKVDFVGKVEDGWLFQGPTFVKRFYENSKGEKYGEEDRVDEFFQIRKYASLALTAIKWDNLDRAIHLLWSILRKAHDFAEAYTRLGQGFQSIGMEEEAEVFYLYALKIDKKHAPAYLHMGRILAEREDYWEAINYFSNAIKYDPGMSAVHFEMGNCFFLVKDYREAIRSFQNVVHLDPKNLDGYLKLSGIYQMINDYINALRILNEALFYYPEHFEIHFELGNAYYARSDMVRAIDSYEKALEIKPDDFEACIRLGKTYEMVKETDKAIRNYENAVMANRFRIEGYLYLARLYRNLKLIDKVEEITRTAVQIQPDSVEANLILADAYYQVQKYPQAERQYRDVVFYDPGHEEANLRLGILYRQSGRIEDAVAVLEKMVERESNRAEVYLLLGECLKGKSHDVLDIYRKGLKNSRDHAVLYFNMGYLYWKKLDSPKLAREAFEKAIAAYADYPEAYFHLGQLMKEKKDTSRSIRFLRKALELNPQRIDAYLYLAGSTNKIPFDQDKILNRDLAELKDYSQAPFARYEMIDIAARGKLYYRLGTVYLAKGKWKNAALAFDRTLRWNPAHAEALSNLVIAYRAQDRLDVALGKLSQLLKNHPQVPEIYVEMGNIHKYLGQKEKAYENYVKAQDLAPGSPIIKEAEISENLKYDKEELLAQGDAHLRDQEYFLAERKYGAVLSLDEYNLTANLRIWNLYNNSGRTEKAIAILRKMVENESDQAEFYLRLGERVNAKDAVRIYRRGVDYCSGKAVLFFNLGYVYWRELNEPDSAREAFEQAIASYPAYAKAYFYLGYILKQENDIPQAIRFLEKAVELDPDRINAYMLLAELGEEEYYQQLFLDGNQLNLADTKWFSKAPNAQFELDAQDEKQQERFFYKLGIIYMGSGKWQNAIAAFNHVLKQNPDNTEVLKKISIAYKALGRFQEALKKLYRLLYLRPGNPEIFFEIGNIYKGVQQNKSALESYLKARNLVQTGSKESHKLDLALAELYYDIWQAKKEKDLLMQTRNYHEKVLQAHPEYHKLQLRLENIAKLLSGQVQVLVVTSRWRRKYKDIIKEIQQNSTLESLNKIVQKYPKNAKITFIYPQNMDSKLSKALHSLKDGEISPLIIKGEQYIGIYRISSADGGKSR